jgi:hypothetical protein
MIITFCGHAQFQRSEECEKKLLTFLEEKVGDSSADIYLGGYGNFDAFAYGCCKKYQESHPNISLVFVTPYLSNNHLQYQKDIYDAVLYPEIENKPLRYAITYRNRYMVEKADYIIAYVSHDWGGAYATYKHAQRKGKKIFNLANLKNKA